MSAPGPPSPYDVGMRELWASLFRLDPLTAPAWPRAIRAAVALGLPVAIAALLGVPHLGYTAAVGSFAALYSGTLPARERAKAVPFIAVGLVIAAALGVAVGWSRPLTVLVLALVAIVAAVLVYGFSVGPPGVMFFVLVYGMFAHVRALSSEQAAIQSLLALVLGTLLTYVIAIAPLFEKRPDAPTRPLREILPRSRWDDAARLLLERTIIVALVGSVAGLFIDPVRAYWIVAAGVTVVGISVARTATVGRGVHRMVGTVVGAGVYLVLVLFPWEPLGIAVLLAVLQFGIELVIARNYALALILITPLVLVLTGAAAGQFGSVEIAGERIVDTIVGSVLAVAVTFVPLPALRGRRGARG